MSRSRDDLASLLELSIDDLYAEIGGQLHAGKTHLILPTRARLIADARQWFREKSRRIGLALCSNGRIRELSSSEYVDRIQLAALAADSISTSVTGVQPFTAAALIVKIGVKHLCRGSWSGAASERRQDEPPAT